MNGLPVLTDATRRTLALAMTTAGRAGAATIAPEHLLVGLLLDPTQDAHSALVCAGALPSQLAELPGRLVPALAKPEPGVGAGLAYTSRTKQAILAAASEARLDGVDAAAPRHLLRGLLQDAESPAALALHGMGVTLDALRDAGSGGSAP
jgi:ATP-dependent Clp protease ATP-binding subunit ClpA